LLVISCGLLGVDGMLRVIAGLLLVITGLLHYRRRLRVAGNQTVHEKDDADDYQDPAAEENCQQPDDSQNDPQNDISLFHE